MPSAADAIPPEIIDFSFREAGLRSFGLLARDALRAACSGLSSQLAERLGLDRARGAVAAALAYCEGGDYSPSAASAPLIPDGEQRASLARFARADWYGELAARLKDAANRIMGRLRLAGMDPGAAREWRYFVNSALPEKRIALESGLGRLGRHGLVMLPVEGSAAVLGVLLLPLGLASEGFAEAPASAADLRHARCADCGACVAACPTGALGDGRFSRELCLQHWSSVAGALPPDIEAAWGDRLYGCDLCQEACPLFSPDPAATTARGRLGPGLSAARIVAASDAELRAALKGSVLDMGWIAPEALRRNAALALRAR